MRSDLFEIIYKMISGVYTVAEHMLSTGLFDEVSR